MRLLEEGSLVLRFIGSSSSGGNPVPHAWYGFPFVILRWYGDLAPFRLCKVVSNFIDWWHRRDSMKENSGLAGRFG
jgi:hypothetical protein